MPTPDSHRDIDKAWNRDDQQKPGSPPRSASEPKGAEASTRSDKTATDPASGEPTGRPPAPNRADAEPKTGN
ncbi:hypothetical protein [Phenylobacterium sp.]|uniref:hypothetical protein n=1 Tax=Phenylobacterium sp. TaxID=1871053 RepID=UPI002DE3BF58|nr:hypothetical protein [Phenylobacterium sp.]